MTSCETCRRPNLTSSISHGVEYVSTWPVLIVTFLRQGFEMEGRGPAVGADVGDVPSRTDGAGAQDEALRFTRCLDDDVGTRSLGQIGDHRPR
ncbi:hypothetical protein GCM10010251_27240 [Streptomyces aurantiogriseus]|uniref:Uncharacterized protein n=1 Tax=Streptomyces aurantiogriseus TaxID=66870 RepID=A0A918F6N9_9ACTN|nr:hypothetical protein GCM10010251_27240 [Streptomyces aurantiogriseus]